MDTLTSKRIALMLFNIVVVSVAQVCLKQGMLTAKVKLPSGILQKIQTLVTVIFTNPYVLIGFLLFAGSSLMWLSILKSVPLSLAYPTIALCYVIVTFLSWILFGERVNWLSVTGLFVICCGVVMLGVGLTRAASR